MIVTTTAGQVLTVTAKPDPSPERFGLGPIVSLDPSPASYYASTLLDHPPGRLCLDGGNTYIDAVTLDEVETARLVAFAAGLAAGEGVR